MSFKTLKYTLATCAFIGIQTTKAQSMHFERIFDETLAQASYIIANENKEAIVIDPKRDIDTYLTFAQQNGLTIKYVTETHIHADYLSGAPELAHATQAQLLLSAEGGKEWTYNFSHQPLKNKQTISLGNVQIQVLHTPGHTSESITFLVRDLKQPKNPIKAITGDFIFVGDVGRPDLLEKAFTQYILDGQPEPPKYFYVMKQLNKTSRPLQIALPKLNELNISELQEAVKKNILIIDTRKKDVVEKGFISGSLHIEGGKTFATFVGSLVDYDQQLVLVGDAKQINDLQRKLSRIGMDNILGYSSDIKSYNGLQTSKIINASEVQQLMKQANVQLIDVRTVAEYQNGHIQGFENIPLNTLEYTSDKIQKDDPVIIHCQSGVRSAIAYSILNKLGYTNILNYSGGINDWKAKQLPLMN